MIRKPFVEEKEHVQSGDGTVTFPYFEKRGALRPRPYVCGDRHPDRRIHWETPPH